MIRPAGIATSVSPPKNIASLAVFRYLFHNPPIHAILWRFCLSCHNQAATKFAKLLNLLLLSASCFCRLVKILQLFLQQNRLHQVQKNVPINDYFTFVTAFLYLRKCSTLDCNVIFCFFNNLLYVQ